MLVYVDAVGTCWITEVLWRVCCTLLCKTVLWESRFFFIVDEFKIISTLVKSINFRFTTSGWSVYYYTLWLTWQAAADHQVHVGARSVKRGSHECTRALHPPRRLRRSRPVRTTHSGTTCGRPSSGSRSHQRGGVNF